MEPRHLEPHHLGREPAMDRPERPGHHQRLGHPGQLQHLAGTTTRRRHAGVARAVPVLPPRFRRARPAGYVHTPGVMPGARGVRGVTEGIVHRGVHHRDARARVHAIGAKEERFNHGEQGDVPRILELPPAHLVRRRRRVREQVPVRPQVPSHQAGLVEEDGSDVRPRRQGPAVRHPDRDGPLLREARRHRSGERHHHQVARVRRNLDGHVRQADRADELEGFGGGFRLWFEPRLVRSTQGEEPGHFQQVL